MRTSGARGGFGRLAIASCAFALVASACGGSSGGHPSSAPPAPVASTTTRPPSTSTTLEKPKPYDPTKPIDLGGTPGVTPAEQHRAEQLVRSTLVDLRSFTYPSDAMAAGYRTIGDAGTGDEHFVKWSAVNDHDILDPKQPESLVYEVRDGKQQIAAAMFMLPIGSRFTDAPDVGGALTQWHVHRDLCFKQNPSDSLQWLVQGQTDSNGDCPAGQTQKGNEPMMHVWIVKNACGPFAGLTGEPGGQIAPGEQRLCDKLHGSV